MIATELALECPECGYEWTATDPDETCPECGDEVDDDPQCVCGVYRSEHKFLGCQEGFSTPDQWEVERAAIRQRVFDEDGEFLGFDDDREYWSER